MFGDDNDKNEQKCDKKEQWKEQIIINKKKITLLIICTISNVTNTN